MTRAAIYARISQDRTGAGLKVEQQEADCRALAVRLGWDVVEVYTDNDVSAHSGRRRPGYERMLSDVEAGVIDGILCWHTDRLHRRTMELEEFMKRTRERVPVQTVTAGNLDLSTPSGRLVARNLGAAAAYEGEHKAERVLAKQRVKAKAGEWLGGARPFGWKVVDGALVVVPAEAEAVRAATRAFLDGESLGTICRRLNSQKVTTARGRPWSVTVLRQMLLRPRNAGLTTWAGKEARERGLRPWEAEVVNADPDSALVSEAEWRQTVAMLTDKDRRDRYTHGNRVRHLMSGLAVCECGAPVGTATQRRRDGSVHTIYRCKAPGAGHVGKLAAKVDEVVEEVIVGVLSDPANLARVTADPDDAREDLHSEAEALRGRLAELEGMLSDPSVPISAYQRAAATVTDRLAEIEGEMAVRARGGALRGMTGPDAAARWAEAPVEKRRAIVAALAVVRLRRHGATNRRTFDPTTVEFDWRR